MNLDLAEFFATMSESERERFKELIARSEEPQHMPVEPKRLDDGDLLRDDGGGARVDWNIDER